MNELETYIRSYFDASQEDIQQLASFFRNEQLEKGDFHTREGQYNSGLSFVRDGYLRIYSIQKGKEVTQWITSPGEFVTELGSLLFQTTARWHIQALTEVSLYTISAHDYRELPHMLPNWLKLERLFVSKCFMFLEDRVHAFLSLTAEERYEMMYAEKRELFNQVPL